MHNFWRFCKKGGDVGEDQKSAAQGQGQARARGAAAMSVASVLQAKGGPFQDDEVTAISASHLLNALAVGHTIACTCGSPATQKLFGFASDCPLNGHTPTTPPSAHTPLLCFVCFQLWSMLSESAAMLQCYSLTELARATITPYTLTLNSSGACRRTLHHFHVSCCDARSNNLNLTCTDDPPPPHHRTPLRTS